MCFRSVSGKWTLPNKMNSGLNTNKLESYFLHQNVCEGSLTKWGIFRHNMDSVD